MEKYITYEEEYDFFIAMSDYNGTSLDNKEALGIRFVLVFIEKGSGIATLDSHPIPYIAPCLFCVNEKEHIVIEETEHSKIRAIFFAPCVINSFLNYDNIRCLPPDAPFTLVQDNNLIQYFLVRKDTYRGKFNLGPVSEKKFVRALSEINKLLSEQTTNWPCKSRSYLIELLFFIDKLFETGNFSHDTYIDTLNDDFQPILLYIYHNYDKKITINEIIKQFHLSRTTLSKMFQANLGETYLSYLNKLRITIASTMLRDTMLPVSEIMLRVGFHDSAHFLRTFKKYTTLSPSAYREEYCWM